MAWPTGVTLRTCSLGPDFGIVSGSDYGCDIVVSVSRPTMTWGATGSGGIGDTETLTFVPGQEVSFQLPVTDQVGWYIGGLPVDLSNGRQSHVYTLTIKPWIYNALGRKTYSNATLTLSNLAIPTGTDPLDLDMSVATSGAQGGTVTLPDLVSQLEAVAAAPTDSFVADRISDPDSETTAALNAAYAPVAVVDDVTDLDTRVAAVEQRTGASLIVDLFANSASTPVVFMHRNASALFPEETQEGMIAAAGLGIQAGVIDLDANALLGGGVGLMHDDTVDRTTTASGSTTGFSVAQWMSLSVDAGNWFAPAWPTLKAPLASWALDMFGGTTGLSIEAKTDAVLPLLINEIKKRSLEGQVLINTSSLTRIATIKAAGIHATYYFPTPADAANATTRAAVQAAAPDSIVVQSGTDSTSLATIIGWGIPVLAGETDRRYEWQQFRAAGCAGLVGNDPLYTLGLSPALTHDTWSSQTWGNGYAGASAGLPNRSASINFAAAGKIQFKAVAATPTQGAQNSVSIGECSPTPSSTVTIDLYVTIETLPSDMTRYFQVSLRADDHPVLYTAGPSTNYNGYSLNIRASGVLEINLTNTGGATTLLASKTTGITAWTAGERRHLQVQITASAVTVTDVTKGYNVTSADTTYRTPWYLTLGRSDTATTGVGVWSADTLTIA